MSRFSWTPPCQVRYRCGKGLRHALNRMHSHVVQAVYRVATTSFSACKKKKKQLNQCKRKCHFPARPTPWREISPLTSPFKSTSNRWNRTVGAFCTVLIKHVFHITREHFRGRVSRCSICVSWRQHTNSHPYNQFKRLSKTWTGKHFTIV